jgi:hypothetical protein
MPLASFDGEILELRRRHSPGSARLRGAKLIVGTVALYLVFLVLVFLVLVFLVLVFLVLVFLVLVFLVLILLVLIFLLRGRIV